MKFFLTIKHWQLFLFAWGIPIAIEMSTITNPSALVAMFPLIMLVFVFGTFGWIYAIATQLHPKLPAGVNINITLFKIAFAIPIIYFIIICVGIALMMFDVIDEGAFIEQHMGAYISVVVFLHLFSMACIFFCLRGAAKIMMSVELQRETEVGDYIGEFLLIWFQIFGVWFIQPRLNRLVAERD